MKNSLLMTLALAAFFGLFTPRTANAQDWANLEKFREANAQLQAPGKDGARVVFMGNSITEGWAGANPGYFTANPYVNRGIGGQTTPQMLLRFRQDVIELAPKAVIILAGTNDIAGNTGPMTLGQIRDNILSMVQLAKANAILPIVCSVLPAHDYPWRPGKRPDLKIPELNDLLREMAREQDVPYLDYFSAMADTRNGLPQGYTTDGVHLTTEGYVVMEGMVEALLDKVLKNRK